MINEVCGYYIFIEVPSIDEKKPKIDGFVMPAGYEDAEIGASDVGIVRGIGPCAFSGVAATNGKIGIEGAKVWGFEIGDKVEFTRYDGKRPSGESAGRYRYIQDQHIISTVGE